jgi:hypothetical protein
MSDTIVTPSSDTIVDTIVTPSVSFSAPFLLFAARVLVFAAALDFTSRAKLGKIVRD